EILQEIRNLIHNNHLKQGDKIPSERELSEKLHVGRSSVREALRAMELLGLIETKHGEGTFLSIYRPYQTVELLAPFILQEHKTKKDLVMTKKMIEKEIAKLAFSHLNAADIETMDAWAREQSSDPVEKHVTFFQLLVNRTENHLLKKIWQLMEEFSRTLCMPYYQDDFYMDLLQIYSDKKYDAIETLFIDTPYEESLR